MSSLEPTVSARIGLQILGAVRHLGGDPQAVARAVGFDSKGAVDPDARIPLALENRLWEAGAAHLQDPLFGLKAGMAFRPTGGLDVFDYVCRSAADLRGAIERVVRYNRLLHDVAVFSLEEAGDRAIVGHAFRAGIPGPSPLAADCTFASALALARHWTGAPIPARRVAIARPPPDDPGPWQAWAGTRSVAFGTSRTEIELDRALLDLPLIEADPGLCAVLERQADAALAALPEVGGFEARVREAIASLLQAGTPTAAVVASRLHVSTRTLQRRLADAGTSFAAEVDAIRHGLSTRYLADPRISIAEVAFLLGYSEPRAFHRAFKSWTGTTPGTWRKAG